MTEAGVDLFRAGADALVFNAPLSIERATGLVESLSRASAETVLDLGCGRGELARMVASKLPRATVLAIDIDERSVQAARALTDAELLDDRLRFEVADAAEWSGTADAAICVGASHAFGGSVAMLTRLAVVVPHGLAIVGDGVWQAPPSAWCLETFGELLDGPDALAAEATRAGWTVVETDSSSLAEWDEFEHGWIDGVRAVGTDEAVAFADERARQYENYRGLLGFCWLVLTRE